MRHTNALAAIELLVVLALVAILASAAMPTFQGAILEMRRAEGQAALQELMEQQERYYNANNSYKEFSSAATDAEARQFRWWSGRSARSSAYEVEGKPCTGEDIEDCIQLIATPGTPNVDSRYKDPNCAQLTLTSEGERAASGPAKRCWR